MENKVVNVNVNNKCWKCNAFISVEIQDPVKHLCNLIKSIYCHRSFHLLYYSLVVGGHEI